MFHRISDPEPLKDVVEETISEKSIPHIYGGIDFIPCQYHEGKNGKDSYVWWSLRHPETGKMVRFKKMLCRKCYKTKIARALAVQQIFAKVWNDYVHGITPWTKVTRTVHVSTLFTHIIKKYSDHLEKETQKNIKKAKTVTDYRMRIRILTEYLTSRGLQNMKVEGFDVKFCTEFLDYVLYERDTGTANRNNYRRWLGTLAGWMIERKYIKENPVTTIAILPTERKFREAIPVIELKRMTEYLRKHDKRFLLACMFEYYTFIRPIELVQIKVRDVSVKNQSVFVSAEVSKNRKDGFVALNDTILKLMIELGVLNAPNEFYLFGKGFQPAEKKSEYKIFGYHWQQLRQKMGWPKSYQFYSLKDSGIRDLANSIGAVTAKEQARHSSLEITSLYTVSPEGKVNEDTKHFQGYL